MKSKKEEKKSPGMPGASRKKQDRDGKKTLKPIKLPGQKRHDEVNG